jgi:hypothetical protein
MAILEAFSLSLSELGRERFPGCSVDPGSVKEEIIESIWHSNAIEKSGRLTRTTLRPVG